MQHIAHAGVTAGFTIFIVWVLVMAGWSHLSFKVRDGNWR